MQECSWSPETKKVEDHCPRGWPLSSWTKSVALVLAIMSAFQQQKGEDGGG